MIGRLPARGWACAFDDFQTFLLAVQRRWLMMLEVRLDCAIEEGRTVDLECFADLCRSLNEQERTLHGYLESVGRGAVLQRALDEHRWRVQQLFGIAPGYEGYPGGAPARSSPGVAADRAPEGARLRDSVVR